MDAREFIRRMGRQLAEDEKLIKQGICPRCGKKSIEFILEDGIYRHVYCTENGCDYDDNEL